MTTGYRRVSRSSPCRICGKPDWCSTTIDNGISFCARATANANRISCEGWGIFYRNLNESFVRRNYIHERKQSFLRSPLLAPIEHRNEIYRKLLQLSPLEKCAYRDLDERLGTGLGIDQSKYAIYQATVFTRDSLAATIAESCGSSKDGFSFLKGVPGFWRGSNGDPRLGSRLNLVNDLLLIPFIDANGLIQACQLRYSGPLATKRSKYLWLSSIREPDGCGPGTPLHHEGAMNFEGRSFGAVLVTEGALKAATVQHFLPGRYVVANAGVATSHPEIVQVARKKSLEIAFDADCFTNPHVARAMASLLAMRIREQRFLSCDKPTKILTWDKRFKGIDDALIAGVSLRHLDISEWLAALMPECFEAAWHRLEGISL